MARSNEGRGQGDTAGQSGSTGPSGTGESDAGGGNGAPHRPHALDGLLHLLAGQNPYTSGQVEDMDIYIAHPTGNPLPAPTGASGGDPRQDDNRFSQIEMEIDGDYPGTWEFKGQPQKINRALRIKYRCKVRKKNSSGNQHHSDPVEYWMTAYLLVGFEDGGF
jgi:hypothetical protein